MIDTTKLNTGCIGRKVTVKHKSRSAVGNIVGVSMSICRLVDWNQQGVCVLDDSQIAGERWIEKELVDPYEPLPKTTALESRGKGFWR
jgi:hypothetical protein